MRWLAPLLVLASLAVATPAHADATLDGVRVHTTERTTQVVTVKHTRGWHARVTYWTREPGGPWEARRQVADGRTGYGGLVRAAYRRQGTGTTPLGTFGLPWFFGTHARDDMWQLPYRRIRPGDYWVQDNASDYYNRYRNKAQGGFRWWLPSSHPDSSERLTDFGRQYEYASSRRSTASRSGTAGPGSSCTSTAAAPPPAASAHRGGCSATWCGCSTPYGARSSRSAAEPTPIRQRSCGSSPPWRSLTNRCSLLTMR